MRLVNFSHFPKRKKNKNNSSKAMTATTTKTITTTIQIKMPKTEQKKNHFTEKEMSKTNSENIESKLEKVKTTFRNCQKI